MNITTFFQEETEMMKKLSKIALLAAASAFMLAVFPACGNDDDDGETPPPVTKPDEGDGDQNQNQGEGGDQNQNGDGDFTGEATTDSWDFTTYSDAIWVNPETSGSLVMKAEKYGNDGTYTLSADASVKGAGDVLTLIVTKAGTGKGQSKGNPNYSYSDGSTDGLRIKSDALKITNVKGKVALKIEWSCISGKAAGERNLEVTVGDDGTTDSVGIAATTGGSGNVAMPSYEREFDAKSGTNIYIGASNNVFIKKITITKQADSFSAATDDSTANDLATLGLVGKEVASDNAAVATAEIAGGKIKVASVSAGSATLTVTDAKSKTATVSVTVKSSGEIVIDSIAKFTRSAPVLAEKTNANSKKNTKGSAKASWDGLTDLEYSLDGESFVSAEDAKITPAVDGTTVSVTGLDAGTYYIRGAASDAYEASAALKIVINDDGKEVTAYTLDVSTAEFTITKAKTSNDPTEGYAEVDDMKFEVSGNKNKDLPDAQKTVKVVNLGGAVSTSKNYIKFTTKTTASVTVRFFNQGQEGRHAKIMNADSNKEEIGSEATAKFSNNISDPNTDTNVLETTFSNLPTDTYYLGGDNGIYITKVIVAAE